MQTSHCAYLAAALAHVAHTREMKAPAKETMKKHEDVNDTRNRPKLDRSDSDSQSRVETLHDH